MQWKSKNETLLSETDDYEMDNEDQKSISSESSGDCGGIPLMLPANQTEANRVLNEKDCWQDNAEVEKIVKELPNSENVMAILNSNLLGGFYTKYILQYIQLTSNRFQV